MKVIVSDPISKQGIRILKDSNINYIEASTLEEAANKAVAALK
mgnify:CR=1 FL=1